MKLFNENNSGVSIMLKDTFHSVKPNSFSESFSFDFISYEKYKDRLKRSNLLLSPEHPYEERSLESLNIKYKKVEYNNGPLDEPKVEPTDEVSDEVLEEAE